MAISASYFGGGWDASGNSTVSTSKTTTTGRLYFAVVSHWYINTAFTPTISNSLGITWTQIVSTITTTQLGRVALYYGVCSAGATGTFTVTYCTDNGGGTYKLTEITGASATPIVQTVTSGAGTTSSPISISLAAFGSASNATFAAYCILQGSVVGTATAKGGWTELNALDTSLGANAPSLTQCFIASNDTSPNETFTGTGANAYGFAVEIQAGVSSVIDAFTCTIKNSVMLMGCGI